MKSFVLSAVLLASVPLLAQAPAGAPAAPPEHHHEGFQGAGMRQLPAPVANLPITAQFTSTGQMTTPDGQQRSFSGTRTATVTRRDAFAKTLRSHPRAMPSRPPATVEVRTA